MKTINSTIENLFSIIGILALTVLTVSIYSIMTPRLVSKDDAKVAGVTVVQGDNSREPDIDLINSTNPHFSFKTQEKNKIFAVQANTLGKSEAAPILKVRNPNAEQLPIKIHAVLKEDDSRSFEILFKYAQQTLTLNSLTGFTKTITLPANTAIEIVLTVNNLLSKEVEEANFNVVLEY